MLDTSMIQTRGFRNAGGGFQVRLRLPYYRGIWTNLLEGVSITVDGEQFAADSIGWDLAGHRYSLTELVSDDAARWPVDVPATLTVPRDEPLTIGSHTVAAELRLHMSYIPEVLQPTIWSDERRLVITR